MLNVLPTAIRAGSGVEDVPAVDLATVFDDAWEPRETNEATKESSTDIGISADKTALRRRFEHLLRTALEHGETTATIRGGAPSNGVYFEDSGVGIPEREREQVFEPGSTTKKWGTGVGLPSIQQIVLAHNWTSRIATATDGGTRFEITDATSAAE